MIEEYLENGVLIMDTNCSKCNHSIFDHSDDSGCETKGCSCSSGFEDAVEDLLNRWEMKILRLETERDNEHDNALEWAAEWITGAQLLGRSEEVQEFARSMAMSIRAEKRGLTKRAADGLAPLVWCDACKTNHIPECGCVRVARR